MKHRQKQKAKALYISDAYSNTQIAEQVGVNRRTIMLWAREGNWQQQREVELQLPALIAERSYLLADSYTSSLLTRPAGDIQLRDVKIIHHLATGISRLQNKPEADRRKEVLSIFIKKASGTKLRTCAAA